MLITDPNQCRVAKHHVNTAVKTAINKYIIAEYGHLKHNELLKLKRFKSDRGYLEPVTLYGLSALEQDVPALIAPYINQENNWIALDARQLVVCDKNTMTARIKNDSEYQFAVQRFVLSALWATGTVSSLQSMKLPQLVFGDWVSMSIGRKFGLDMVDTFKLYILGCIYYATMFTDHFTADDLDKLKIGLKSVVAVSDAIDQVYLAAGEVNSLDDFCSACYKVTGNIRLKSLDYNVLVSVMSNSWFGLNSQDNILMALEHPPTWIAMVYTAVTQRSQRNSTVSKLAESRGKRGVTEEFLSTLTSLTLDYKGD